jgi:sec-independent protein translocase protein TatB
LEIKNVFGIGWTEFIVIALVLLIFVGPKNLPPLLRKVGGIMAEFKSASRELRNQLDVEVKALDLDQARTAIEDFGKDALEEAARPYEELKKADREIKKGMLEAHEEIRKDVFPNLGPGGKPVTSELTEEDKGEEKPVGGDGEMGE